MASVLMKKQFLRITSSVLGGGGLAVTPHLVADRLGETLPPIALVGILLGGTGMGILAQHYLSQRRGKQQKEEA